MKIALLAPIEESVPPKKYGGTERVVFNLAEELVGMGHQVDLYASGDSITSAKLIPTNDLPIRTLLAQTPRDWYAKLIESTYFIESMLKTNRYDIVHSHLDELFMLIGRKIKQPLITTVHNPVAHYLNDIYKGQNYVSISNAQRKFSPGLKFISTIYNGINLDKYEFNPTPKNYLIFLGRISPDKGIVEAIKIAKKTRNKLIIVAKVDPQDRTFYREEVKPLIDGKRIIYLGELDEKDKIEILRQAKALLSPIQWEEPFGLVNIEALACGVPVLTMRRGSIPEIFKDAKVGFLCDTIEELTVSVGHINEINRADCRAHVEKYFSSKIMARNYIKAYKKAIKLKFPNRSI